METIETNATILIPPEVALCPYCKTKLTAQFSAWTQEDDDTWAASEIQLDCETEPDIEADEWDDWMNEHSDMPYVYMLPVTEKVLAWVNRQYRFNLS